MSTYVPTFDLVNRIHPEKIITIPKYWGEDDLYFHQRSAVRTVSCMGLQRHERLQTSWALIRKNDLMELESLNRTVARLQKELDKKEKLNKVMRNERSYLRKAVMDARESKCKVLPFLTRISTLFFMSL
jgi:hypothetical protein